jgi:GT2 family glycosyltransferase
MDGETALVVEAGDAIAMAAAIERLLDDEVLAKQLSANGLDLVARDFDWETRTDELLERLDGVVAGALSAPPPSRPAPPAQPQLSVVVLAWDNLVLTQRFVESARRHTDVPYELVVVDNGSQPEAATYAGVAGDTVVLNDTNLGFSVGMNQGLEASKGEWVAFCNNDTVLPEGWASRLLETARRHPNAGIIVPAITAANNPVTVRTEPGTDVEVLPPFSAPPAAVIYLARADVIRQLGAWGTEYEIASAEDVDLAFKVWVNDLDIVYDQRVLVEHISKGTASRLDNWQHLWAQNRRRFLDKWSGDDPIPRLEGCSPERHARNRQTAAAVAGWMDRYFTIRDRATAVGLASEDVDDGADPVATGWLEVLAADPPPPGTGRLLRDPTGKVFLAEGSRRRPIGSGLMAAALEPAFGPPIPTTTDELDGLAEAPPVAVMLPRKGGPVLVAGGRRHAIRGLPLARAADEETALLPVGEPLDVAAAHVSRALLAPYERAARRPLRRARRAVGRARRRLLRR